MLTTPLKYVGITMYQALKDIRNRVAFYGIESEWAAIGPVPVFSIHVAR